MNVFSNVHHLHSSRADLILSKDITTTVWNIAAYAHVYPRFVVMAFWYIIVFVLCVVSRITFFSHLRDSLKRRAGMSMVLPARREY